MEVCDHARRDDPKLIGTDKETCLLNPEQSFYKNFALDCSRNQICVDTYLFTHTPYTDVPTLGKFRITFPNQVTGIGSIRLADM